jgi:hypothetical protein
MAMPTIGCNLFTPIDAAEARRRGVAGDSHVSGAARGCCGPLGGRGVRSWRPVIALGGRVHQQRERVWMVDRERAYAACEGAQRVLPALVLGDGALDLLPQELHDSASQARLAGDVVSYRPPRSSRRLHNRLFDLHS